MKLVTEKLLITRYTLNDISHHEKSCLIFAMKNEIKRTNDVGLKCNDHYIRGLTSVMNSFSEDIK